MLALQRANPGAFQNNNINNLKAGATLTIPSREEIVSISAREARNEVNRQYQAWTAGPADTVDVAAEEVVEATPAEEAAPAVVEAEEPAPAVMTESRLQLTAPEDDTVQGAAAAGDPEAGDSESGSSNIEQQLALATETAEANRAQSEELMSRVTELEEQLQTMKRLLELKNDQLASMQNKQAAAVVEETPPPSVAESVASTEDAGTGAKAAAEKDTLDAGGIINKLIDNPILAGLGVLVAMLLGGLLWASTRRKDNQGIFDDEMTLEKRLAEEETIRESKPMPTVAVSQAFEEPVQTDLHDTDEGDPLTEADVYLAYGRIQQAEDVLQAALEKTPDNAAMRLKLLEVYHAGGNVTAFDREASDFRDTVTEDDATWLRVAAMGYELSPDNELYKAAARNANNLDFDMDLTGMDDLAEHYQEEKPVVPDDLGLDMETRESSAEESPEDIEFNLDDLDTTDITFDETALDDEEEAAEGLLDVSDEISTKLDLARAYLDMGDPEGARGILDEVLEEGNEEQKDEAGKLIAELA